MPFFDRLNSEQITLALSHLQINGSDNKLMIERLSAGCLFGEMCSWRGNLVSPAQYQSASDCEILHLGLDRLLSNQYATCPVRPLVIENLFELAIEQNLLLNQWLRILTQRRVRDKLLIYLLLGYTRFPA